MLSRPMLRVVSALAAGSLLSCASASVSKGRTSPSEEAGQADQQLRTIQLLCHDKAHYVLFEKVGVPFPEYPIDVALTKGHIWVLFRQRLVQLERKTERLEVQMYVSPLEEEWSQIDVDPVDETLWVAAQTSLSVYRSASAGKLTRVTLQAKVEGKGGFYGLRVGRDAIYAQPTCAETAVWRIDRSGKLLGTAFEAPPEEAQQEEEVLRPDEIPLRCSAVRLDRDADGRILAWTRDQETWEVDESGTWKPSDSPLLDPIADVSSAISLKGLDVGKETELWYFNSGYRGQLFFWKGQPVFLGSWTMRATGSDTLLYLPNARDPAIMPCQDAAVHHVATDARGYAAISHRFVVFGDFAEAPDLP